MPQLVPFYFINILSFGFLIFTVLLYISSVYVLPRYNELFISRSIISSL
ncbi:ATP synthase F0 subunit 8 (mitochondrion) [Schizosaccharomyces pombe]|uniref:ATP synthase protein 8 n=2 Tax=Schizosaccharomyces pombe TaxID=4896 RepID=ATP8_SCHPO|nr:ATPase 8 [Schizosaccharomyces pombe]P21536.3 RecName: Full=ATP synthase protein 8; AltName: Full=A6L; AltName: Full=F-ATPase subunit 8 [Schizosaccharomyces pombe 972h-]QDP17091.1 ATP synthase F0 subunit 8 [Schizosaccharomyces pombe]QDP17102.1 ATP synthase F0 subunit 8 [Schizosaccharomyces pombe]QDP17113.1 ATP synthase F0 subunit 8 [Schizosaccharomyces pombe]QDP17124.1 ATP synthase F0 subunit 8 [Schizosaccharomyces pombe]QDP17135.1 ATP synthase F0 subunit 8 [Schizosaccharomyces pombe]|eukprot:NP_039506.1 ATPase 8 (mitochondrion) [Schizosaccharomyces pombe]